MTHDRRIWLLALLAGLPGTLLTLLFVWTNDYSPKVVWTVTALVPLCWLGLSSALRGEVVRPLQSISNLLKALREGDFSVRGRAAPSDEALGAAVGEVNALADVLKTQRLGALEATTLLRTVMEEIDVAVLAFDGSRRLELVNRAGARLLGQSEERLKGASAEELKLTALLEGEAPRRVDTSFPGGAGPHELKRTVFRRGGERHDLLVIADVRRALREEEREAWQRLVRVLGHEINNSLAPIRSIAQSLIDGLGRAQRPPGWEEDAASGLKVVARRAEALGRFTQGYARLAKLPPPHRQPMDVATWVKRVCGLETRVGVEVQAGPALSYPGDADQLDQVLINLVKNGADAALETKGRVQVAWRASGRELTVTVCDEGPGLAAQANLFTPFFTTKPEGSGIGLVLSRQIVEAHGGRLSLENRSDRPGCVATVALPL
jgi:two-component system, NtrC family, nitrogen regulation sensor histidine kinase NtrY